MMIGADLAWAARESAAAAINAAGLPASWMSTSEPNAPNGTDDSAAVPTTRTGAPLPRRSAA